MVETRVIIIFEHYNYIIHVIGVYFQIFAGYFKADLENVLVCCLSTDLPFCAPTGFSIIYFVPF